MFLDDGPPLYGGRELWGFPKKLAQPHLAPDKDTLVGTLDYGSVRIATGTMGYKYKALDLKQVAATLALPNYLLKIIPHVDGTPAHPRVGRLPSRGRRAQGGLEWPRRARSSPARSGTHRRSPGPRDHLGNASSPT